MTHNQKPGDGRTAESDAVEESGGDRAESVAATGGPEPAPSVRRRTMLKGLGSGAIVAGLAGCPQDGGGSDGGGQEQTETQCFEKKVPCPSPCEGDECVFRIEFTYDFTKAGGGKIDISRFRLEFVEGTSGETDCRAEFGSGSGTFEFDVQGESPCSINPANVWNCPCGTDVQFEDLDESDGEDCVCPNWSTSPDCGEPVWIQKQGDFESIDIDFEQDLHCICETSANRDSMEVRIQFQNGNLTFGGDTAGC